MLGSLSEADDAVQETWLRLARSDTSDVHNLRGWLTTVVARVCLDMLRSRKARREDPGGDDALDQADAATPTTAAPPPALALGHAPDPEQEAVLAETVGLAVLVVLD